MYVPLLILRYLARRRIAWVSLVAVMLCTALVLVVISVMSGWLDNFRSTFKGLSGDVVVRVEGLGGFPYYEEMQAELEKLAGVEAVVPTVEALGLANINNGQLRQDVQVVGLPMDRIGLVNDLPQSFFLNHPETSPAVPLAEYRAERQAEMDELAETERELGEEVDPDAMAAAVDGQVAPVEAWAKRQTERGPSFELPWAADVYRRTAELNAGPRRRGPDRGPDPSTYPGVIVGTGVIGLRQSSSRWTGLWPNQPVPIKLLLLALDDDGSIDVEQDRAEFTGWVVDSSRTGVFGRDDKAVYADFGYLQSMLRMDAAQIYPDGVDADGNPVGEPMTVPARASKLHLALAADADRYAIAAEAETIVQAVLNRHDDALGYAPKMRSEPWDEQPTVGPFLRAVEKERALIVILFSFVSVVAVFLILCIFYMIVKEKTRDIGILKSVGATSAGIASIFLGYGAAIGLLGGALGVLAGSTFVWNINAIHDALGLLGFQMWSADTYMFDTIPNTVRGNEAAWIFVAAVVSSIVGAVVPAIVAAVQRPVTSLRFE